KRLKRAAVYFNYGEISMNSNRLPAGLCLLGLCLLGFGVTVQADQVIMKNGDVITGKVTRIVDGKVWVKPAYADEFGVASAEVEKLDAELLFEVELAEHEKVQGQFQLSPQGQQLLVVDGATQPVDLTAVAQAVKPASYYSRTSHAEISATFNSGNTDSQ